MNVVITPKIQPDNPSNMSVYRPHLNACTYLDRAIGYDAYQFMSILSSSSFQSTAKDIKFTSRSDKFTVILEESLGIEKLAIFALSEPEIEIAAKEFDKRDLNFIKLNNALKGGKYILRVFRSANMAADEASFSNISLIEK